MIQNNEVKYMLDIRDRKVCQFKGFKNISPSPEDQNEVLALLQDQGIATGLLEK